MKFQFVIDEKYSRKNIKSIIGHPEPDSVGGIWATGYSSFENNYFIFANIETAGRTGHDYPNLMVEDRLFWFSNGASIHTPMLKSMMSGENEVYIFTREDSKDVNFVFRGIGYVKYYEDTKPAHIVWGFINDLSNVPEEFDTDQRIKFIEGAKVISISTRYERDEKARKASLDYYGYNCLVCGMNFESFYGEIGKSFIHVHHLQEISTIGKEYEIDPIEDLKPVCPNCHAMLHKRKPAYSIDELKQMLLS
ncbi:restriction endonuclease [Sporosarcina sp. P21c]|uniref:HNH endonuclease n=1 Tax=Sporosarcina sp. P21c TaxID=2048255 RepID=UPI000C170411|nr:HNH endonuclease [Sporosarcina sp. P21c]PIC88547.1 restriction endonuclease [Sporosarcina sp. P21c]